MTNKQDSILILTPSKDFISKDKEKEFQNFDRKSALSDKSKEVYYELHAKQTHVFAKEKQAEWLRFDHAEMTVMEALEEVSAFIDESDPDVALSVIDHAYQTAERARAAHPDTEWLHVTCLVHDLGKIMSLFGEPQYCVGGNTWPTGCKYSDKIPFYPDSFYDNPDLYHPVFSSKLGVYAERCGLENLTMSWGHDEYMYWVLKNHKGCKLPDEALYIIRYHSFFPWHMHGDYDYFCTERDRQMLPWVKEFKKFDLYSKMDDPPNPAELYPYYKTLVEKYLPGKVKW